LRAKSIDDVRLPGSEDKIAEEITELVNKKLEELKIEGRIERVYFTEYIVQ
jgi:flagellar basal body-associated protein FliL